MPYRPTLLGRVIYTGWCCGGTGSLSVAFSMIKTPVYSHCACLDYVSPPAFFKLDGCSADILANNSGQRLVFKTLLFRTAALIINRGRLQLLCRGITLTAARKSPHSTWSTISTLGVICSSLLTAGFSAPLLLNLSAHCFRPVLPDCTPRLRFFRYALENIRTDRLVYFVNDALTDSFMLRAL